MAKELTERMSVLSLSESEDIGRLAGLEDDCRKLEADMKQMIRHSHIRELTQEVVDTFIKRVYVYKDRRIEIEWNFSVDSGDQ